MSFLVTLGLCTVPNSDKLFDKSSSLDFANTSSDSAGADEPGTGDDTEERCQFHVPRDLLVVRG